MIKVAHLLKKQKTWAGTNSLQALHDNAMVTMCMFMVLQPSRYSQAGSTVQYD